MLLLSLFEVLDRVPRSLILWVLGILLGAAGYVLGQRRAWLGMIPMAFLLLLASLLWTTIGDPRVGAASSPEAANYSLLTYLPLVLGILSSVAGIARGRRDGARAA